MKKTYLYKERQCIRYMVKEKIPKQLVEELMENEEITERDSMIGENRGQLFVRIPKKIRNVLGLEKGDSLNFRVISKGEHKTFEVEVMK